jgi:long-chain acyl-CoA synthetase
MAIAQDRKFVSALLAPNYGAIVDFAGREGIDYDESAIERDETDEITAVPQELLEHDAVQKKFEAAVATANEGLSKYERIKAYSVLDRAFSVEREELTPTLKKRRGTITESFRDRIEAMYGEGSATIDATLTQDVPEESATPESQETAAQD